jgi:hypothetical protein
MANHNRRIAPTTKKRSSDCARPGPNGISRMNIADMSIVKAPPVTLLDKKVTSYTEIYL